MTFLAPSKRIRVVTVVTSINPWIRTYYRARRSPIEKSIPGCVRPYMRDIYHKTGPLDCCSCATDHPCECSYNQKQGYLP